MEPMKIACELETALQRQLDLFSGASSPYLTPVLHYLIDIQVEVAESLSAAEYVNVDLAEYPPPGDRLRNTGADWKKLVEDKLPLPAETGDIVILWSIYTAIDRMEQFYRQAALNSVHPLTRAYFTSLAEGKMFLRRRTDGLIRVLYNDIWGKVGFAPFALRKD
ncbi:MAG: hypothetical protein AB9895_04305 [Negativicutes bacterium]